MERTLVIMAAGMGSRFGGLKQIEPVGPSGEILADYAVYDAIRAGFSKVVFIIRRENLDYFKNNITSKFEDKIKIEFAFQELDKIPSDVKLPDERTKMLGTGHAVWCAKDLISGDFVVINSDDFNSYEAYRKVSEFFDKSENICEYITVNYPFVVTSSSNGTVKRGISYSANGYVVETIESEVRNEDGKFIAKSLIDGEEFEISENQPVAVNFFGFKNSFLTFLDKAFDEFIHGEMTLTNEFFLPEVLKELIKENKILLKEEISDSKWMGMTYKEDLADLKRKINECILEGIYPKNLWED